MIDDGEYINKLSELCRLYYNRLGKEVDLLTLPVGIDLVKVIERMVDTGESPIVGWAKINEGRGQQK